MTNMNIDKTTDLFIFYIFGPTLWGHSGPLCHALSLLSLLWTSMRRRRAAAHSGEWAQHFKNASCYIFLFYSFHVACTMTVMAKKSMKINHKIFFRLLLKTFRYLQPFMLVTIWQPIGGLKRCCCCDWTSSILRIFNKNPPEALQCVLYFRFCGLRRVLT